MRELGLNSLTIDGLEHPSVVTGVTGLWAGFREWLEGLPVTLLLLGGMGLCLFGSFAALLRYPALLGKADPTGPALASIVYSSELWAVPEGSPALLAIAITSLNWLWSMKIGMGFGILMGALLHTALRFHPPSFGSNSFLNQVKGSLMGAPAGVCVNCAVPVVCGISRGGSVPVETMLSFMFSSPTFNVVVVFIVCSTLPWQVAALHYVLVLTLIFGVVPWILRRAELRAEGTADSGSMQSSPVAPQACSISGSASSRQTVAEQCAEVFRSYGQNVRQLFAATVPFMLAASVLSAAVALWVPFDVLFAEVSVFRLALVALITTLLPVPIALDAMLARELFASGVPIGYVFVCLFTLGTFSVLPLVFLWREVSKRIALQVAAALFVLGCGGALFLESLSLSWT